MTIESFLAWKKDFDAEKKAQRSKAKQKLAAARGNKPTGKQLFLDNTTLNDSDIKFLEAGRTIYLRS